MDFTFGEIQRPTGDGPLLLHEWERLVAIDERLVMPDPVRTYRSSSGDVVPVIRPHSRNVTFGGAAVAAFSWSPGGKRKPAGVLIQYMSGHLETAATVASRLAEQLHCEVVRVSSKLREFESMLFHLGRTDVNLELSDGIRHVAVEYTTVDGLVFFTEFAPNSHKPLDGLRSVSCDDIVAVR